MKKGTILDKYTINEKNKKVKCLANLAENWIVATLKEELGPTYWKK